MYKNILVPVLLNDTRDTNQALAVAEALADKGANLTLIHVVESIPLYVADQIPTETLQHNREQLRNHLEAMGSSIPNCRTHLLDGRPGPAIADWAEKDSTDLIVIASHQPVFSDILLGSVATHVVRHAHCAVHVVR